MDEDDGDVDVPRLPAAHALQPFQKKMFSALISSPDVLLVSGTGMGMDRLMLTLLSLYCDPHMLVIVLNMASLEQDLLVEALTQYIPNHPPRVFTNEQSAAERSKIYLRGGVVFVTSRIFVVDMLMERLPINSISGIVVANAHRVTNLSTEAFILRLYRHANRTGFVKALSDNAQGFTGGFNTVEKTMRALWVAKITIWPFFEKSLLKEIERHKPNVYEVNVELTDRMRRAQQAIFEIMTSCLKMLKRLRPSLDVDQLTLERNLFKSFEQNLRKQLDGDWHTLNPKIRQLVHELRILRNVVIHLDQYDCVSFYHLLQSLRSNTRAFNQNSHWQMLDATNDLFEHAKARVFPPQPSNPERGDASSDALPTAGAEPAAPSGARSRRASASGAAAAAAASFAGGAIESNPKWDALDKALATIRSQQAAEPSRDHSGHDRLPRILVCVRDARTASQVSQYLLRGSQAVLQAQLRRYLRWKGDFNALSARGLFNRTAQGSSTDGDAPGQGATRYTGGSRRARAKRRREARAPVAEVDAEERAAMAIPGKADADAPEGLLEDIYGLEGSDDDMDDSQGSAVARDDHILLSADEELERYFDEVAPGDVVITAMQTEDMSATGHASQFAQLLKDLMPLHIVFYDPYLPCVREVQIHQAAHPETRLNVYMMLFKGAFQEQQFLSSIRHEKEAFQHVIHAKRVMAFPVDQDGRLGQRQRNERQLAVRPEEENVSTRRAGGRVLDAPRVHPRVIVDMREFRSSLPGILHEVGLDIEPRTLLVGDYILSPEVCVERKSLADLIGSLASGRLYSQAESMTRHYKRAALLIEFDEDKPFSLLESQQRLTNDIDFRSTMSKLALLTISFPSLRILWSHSPHATARIFLALKQHHREPDGAAASAIGVEALSAGESSEYATEPQAMLRQLPGITPGNMYLVMEKVKSLRELCSMSLERLQELCGPKLGKQLHNFINNMPQSTEAEPAPKRRA